MQDLCRILFVLWTWIHTVYKRIFWNKNIYQVHCAIARLVLLALEKALLEKSNEGKVATWHYLGLWGKNRAHHFAQQNM